MVWRVAWTSLAALALACLPAASAAADEKVSTEFNFALAPPAGDGWQKRERWAPRPSVLLETGFVNREIGRTVCVLLARSDSLGDLYDGQFIGGVEQGLRKSVPNLCAGARAFVNFAGVPALKAWFTGSVGELRLRILYLIFRADGWQYCLFASGPGEGDQIDAELTAAVSGFRFLEPPSTDEPSDAHRAGYRLGYQIGYYGTGVVLLVAIVWILCALRRRRRGVK